MSSVFHNVVKTFAYAISFLSGMAYVFGFCFPQVAFASSGDFGWTADDFIADHNMPDPTASKSMLITDISSAVFQISGWIAAMTVVLFVWRIIITAADRGVFSTSADNNKDGFHFSEIPYVGAYDVDKYPAWSNIFLMFAKQIAIIAGAWAIVNLIMGVIVWIATQLLA